MNPFKNCFISTARASALMAICLCVAGAARIARAGELTLQDDKLLAAFDDNSGALTRLEDKSTGWKIEQRPELGQSFQIGMFAADGKGETIRAEKQHGAEVKKPSANKIRMRWKNLVAGDGKELPITLTATVTLRKGELTFEATVENHSSQLVESIDYPRLGDLTAPAPGV